jgi:hypothetical protein
VAGRTPRLLRVLLLVVGQLVVDARPDPAHCFLPGQEQQLLRQVVLYVLEERVVQQVVRGGTGCGVDLQHLADECNRLGRETG